MVSDTLGNFLNHSALLWFYRMVKRGEQTRQMGFCSELMNYYVLKMFDSQRLMDECGRAGHCLLLSGASTSQKLLNVLHFFKMPRAMFAHFLRRYYECHICR